MSAYDLSCKACGKGFKVRDEYLVGQDILPEPPVDLWAAQDRYKKSKKKSWKPKPLAPRNVTSASLSSRGIYNFTTCSLTAFSILAVIVLREPLTNDLKLLPIAIIAATLVISLVALRNNQFFEKILMNPYYISRNREYYRLLSSGFGHVDAKHFIFNVLGLYFFGEYLMKFLVSAYGLNAPLAFLLIYLSAIVIADLPDLIRHKNNPSYTAVGASGAISAVVAGAAISDPNIQVSLIFLPQDIAVPGLVYAFGYLLISLYLDYRGTGRVAHLAHAVGTIYGVAVVALISVIFGLGFANSSSAVSDYSQSSAPTSNSQENGTGSFSLIDKLNSSGTQDWRYSALDTWANWGAIEFISSGECAVVTFGSTDDVDRLLSEWNGLPWDGETPKLWTVGIEGLVAPTQSTPCAITAAKALNWNLD
jgi:membrane associated rhomboid family serine protease